MLTNDVRGQRAGLAGRDSEVRICAGCGRPMLRTDAVLELLTDREFEIATLLTAGLTNHEIAGRLGLSEKTVKLHLSHVYQKLGVTTRTEAALVLVGWLSA